MGGDHGHRHGHGHDGDRRFLLGAPAPLLPLMAGEGVIGVIAPSLALLSDAGHMLTDAFAIALALIAMRVAAGPPRGVYTYGRGRTEILSAHLNGVTLVLLALYFVNRKSTRLNSSHLVISYAVFCLK